MKQIKPEDFKVKFNSPQGVLWKQAVMERKRRIAMGKMEAELDQVVLEYCEKKVKEDQEELAKV